MTASSHRITRGSDFSRTLKSGARVNARDFVVHFAPVAPHWPDPSGLRRDVAMTGGPWLGLVVSKSVGNAVIRHTVARRLRAAFAATRHLCPSPETFVVLRARRSAAEVSSDELAEQLRSAFTGRRFAEATRAAGSPLGSGVAR
ncbi:ribonuclease P protein component [Gordonia aurantiaca]|uniref:ribonuclease P protein component n=1 Tax=Gordonia sp. B21 TaxID=3151852 RepID=UPI0032677D93